MELVELPFQPPLIALLTQPCDQRHLRQGQKRGMRVQVGWKLWLAYLQRCESHFRRSYWKCWCKTPEPAAQGGLPIGCAPLAKAWSTRD